MVPDTCKCGFGHSKALRVLGELCNLVSLAYLSVVPGEITRIAPVLKRPLICVMEALKSVLLKKSTPRHHYGPGGLLNVRSKASLLVPHNHKGLKMLTKGYRLEEKPSEKPLSMKLHGVSR
jgi:hypothetical protein